MKNFFTSDKIFATLAAGFSIGFGLNSPDTYGAFAAGFFAGALAVSAFVLFLDDRDDNIDDRQNFKE